MVFPMISQRFTSLIKICLFSICLLPALAACDMAHNYTQIDRDAEADMQDYRDAMASRIEEETADKKDGARKGGASIPSLQSYIAEPAETTRSMPLVSVSVNQTVPVKDILYELARQTDFDIELDPSISGSIIFSARQRPLDEVIERISKIAGLRYNFKNDVLRVEVDRPYNKTYKIDYLSYVRSNKGEIRNNVAVVSGDGADTGSGYESLSESESNFWGELETNLTQIVASSGSFLKTGTDPQIQDLRDVNAPLSQNEDGTLNIASLPVNDNSATSPATSGQERPASFSLNKQAGLVSVYASERMHEEVEEYLFELRRSVTSQVLIEAKILEVSLTDQFASGIDWQLLSGISEEGVLGFGTSIGNIANAQRPIADLATSSNFRIGYFGDDIEAIVQAISGFGTVRALASPRLTVLNNQSAVLNVANNIVFFELDIDVTTEEGVSDTEIDSNIRNVPEGVLVNVQPSIDLENRTVAMAVRPTITRVVRSVPDPAVQFVAQQNNIDIESLVPELNVQEIDSVIQVHSGQPIVMGGLLQDRVSSVQEGLPVLGELPLMGSLFRSQDDEISKTELVILLKATIVEAGNNIHKTDRELYRRFSGDRRPFDL